MPALEVHGLVKDFGPTRALHGITFEVPDGGVVGLVGPNGSGKSTLLRIILGLLRPTAGTGRVLGRPLAEPAGYLARIGALIESPAFIPALSARANLTSLAQLRALPPARVDEVLRLVGLLDRAGEPVRRYSLGMKQRLGIAAAMLPDPEMVILDEPTNGLDPAGIAEMRALLRQVGSEGRTVIVSSHQLAELETICDRLVVIRFGDLLFSGPTPELIAQGRPTVVVSAESPGDTPRLAEVLAAAGWTVTPAPGAPHSPDLSPDGRRDPGSSPDAVALRVEAAPGDAATINRVAFAAGITLASLAPRRPSLEDVFLQLTAATSAAPSKARSAA